MFEIMRALLLLWYLFVVFLLLTWPTAATLDDPTKDLLEAEGLPADPDTETTTTEEKQRAEDHFASTHSRQPDGRFVVQLPRKTDPPLLGCSRDHALRRHRQNVSTLMQKGKFEEFQEAVWDYAHTVSMPKRFLLLTCCDRNISASTCPHLGS